MNKKRKALLSVIVLLVLISGGYLIFTLFSSAQGTGPEKRTKTYAEELSEIVEKIKSDPTWYSQVKDRANKYGQSLQERLIQEAEYILTR